MTPSENDLRTDEANAANHYLQWFPVVQFLLTHFVVFTYCKWVFPREPSSHRLCINKRDCSVTPEALTFSLFHFRALNPQWYISNDSGLLPVVKAKHYQSYESKCISAKLTFIWLGNRRQMIWMQSNAARLQMHDKMIHVEMQKCLLLIFYFIIYS